MSMLALTALMAFPPRSWAQEATTTVDVTYLVVTETDNTVTEFALSDAPVVSFSGGELVVTCGDDELRTALSGIRDYSFAVRKVATAIRSVAVTGSADVPTPTFSISDARISGLKPGTRVGVYNLNGNMVSTVAASADGSVSIALDHLPKGVYILRTPTKNFKVVNK